eukprot:1874667-Amphidinium_carterae.1
MNSQTFATLPLKFMYLCTQFANIGSQTTRACYGQTCNAFRQMANTMLTNIAETVDKHNAFADSSHTFAGSSQTFAAR